MSFFALWEIWDRRWSLKKGFRVYKVRKFNYVYTNRSNKILVNFVQGENLYGRYGTGQVIFIGDNDFQWLKSFNGFSSSHNFLSRVFK